MEAEFLRWLSERLSVGPAVRLGFGDDAAVLAASDRDTVVTVDLLTAGVDFLPDQVDLRRVGRKALAVNLSDLAAMAARPTAAVVALALPRAGALEQAIRLYEGLLPLASEFGLTIAGGDTNVWDGALVISVTALGRVHARGPLRRDGAVPGDLLVATGRFGGSILGHHLDFTPRVRAAELLHERYELHAAMDTSDGLSLDLSRLAAASRCGAVLDFDRIPIAEAAVELSRRTGRTPLAHALADGEDFELLLAVPEADAQRMVAEQPVDAPLAIIGRFVPEPGLWSAAADGRLIPLEPAGYVH